MKLKISAWTIILIILTCLIFLLAWQNNIEMSEKWDEYEEAEKEVQRLKSDTSEESIIDTAEHLAFIDYCFYKEYKIKRSLYEFFIVTFIILFILSWRIDMLRKKK